MTKHIALRKKPKDGSWKKILWDIEEQYVREGGKENKEGYTVYGEFSFKSINAFTDRYKFTVTPFIIKGVYVARKDSRWFEKLRFGAEKTPIFHVDSRIPFCYYFRPWYGFCDDSRYVSQIKFDGIDYFRMDRVI